MASIGKYKGGAEKERERKEKARRNKREYLRLRNRPHTLYQQMISHPTQVKLKQC